MEKKLHIYFNYKQFICIKTILLIKSTIAMRHKLFLMLMVFVFINSYSSEVQKLVFENCKWYFKCSDSKIKYQANVPGSIHTDLLANNLINDPFYRTNEKDLQWIGEKDWIYETVFNLNSEIIEKENVEILFYGLDTYADIYK